MIHTIEMTEAQLQTVKDLQLGKNIFANLDSGMICGIKFEDHHIEVYTIYPAGNWLLETRDFFDDGWTTSDDNENLEILLHDSGLEGN